MIKPACYNYLKEHLSRDKRTVMVQNSNFLIHPSAKDDLEHKFGEFLNIRPIPKFNGVLESELFTNSRGYIIKVVDQINVSYQYNLFDCCAVMCRRLLETSIIECYAKPARSNDTRDKEGNFFMFSGLLSIIEKDRLLVLGRSSIQALIDFKKCGVYQHITDVLMQKNPTLIK